VQKQLLSQARPLIYYEGNKAYSGNGSILYGYKLILPEIYTLSEGEFEEMHTMWYRALKDFPLNTIIHKMDIYLKDKFSFSEKENQSFLQKATVKHFNGRDKLTHHSLLFFNLPNPAVLNSARIINPFKKPLKTEEAIKSFEKTKKFFSVDVKKAVDFINTSRYAKIEPISEEEFQYLEHGYFNGFYDDRVTDLDLKESKVGDKNIGVYTLNNISQFGDTVRTSIEDSAMSEREWVYHQGFMDSMAIKLNCDHIYNQVVFIKDHHHEKKKIEKNKDDFAGSRKFAREYKRDAEKLDEYLDEIADDEKIRLVYGHNNIIYYASDESEFEYLTNQIPNLFKSVDIMPYYPKGKNKENIIANSFPGWIGNIDLDNYYGPIDIQQVLCLFTNVAPYRNDNEGVYFNERLNNVPVRKDIWDKQRKRIKARNFFIIAPTGEGKSVVFNHIARQMYESGVSIVIVDLGGSYRKLSLLYPNDTVYIHYKEGEPIGLNPFELKQGEDITAEKIEELSNFVFKLWKKERLPNDGESVALKKIIKGYYTNVHQGHSFPDFYDFIDQFKDTLTKKLELEKHVNLDDFIHICSEFVGTGIYSFLFKKSSSQSERIGGKKFIVFELDEVKENAVLLTIMIHLVAETVRSVIWKDRKSQGIVFFDEFAKMLNFPSVLSSTAYFYQAIRKYEGSVGVAIQSPAQLPENEISQAIIDNTQVMYILQNTKGYEHVIKRFGMRPHHQVQLQSIKNNFSGERKYSEFMLVLGKESNVYRLEIPQEVFYAYQTEGKEYQEIMELYEQSGNMETAITKYMER